MAFDLNKNDGSANDSSGKTPGSSKFDLSKNETEEVVVTPGSSKSKTWIIGLVGLLIVGGGIWYYSSSSKPADTANSASAEVKASSERTVASVTETQAKVKAGVEGADTAAAVIAGADTETKSSGQTTAAVAKPVVVEKPTKSAPVIAEKAVSNDKIIAALNNKIPATFAQGSSSFKRVDQSLIKRVISYLAKNPDASINVNGYASSDGSLEINQTISQARADAFKKYLVSKNVAESRVVASGKGIENPIASNDTNAGRKKNRRVEIVLP